ncbi:NAD-binding protein [Leekyejoonella antrihumi]|uniref:Potassium transporter TrkA n=1 Tax=Leekyejoonella antrihumi TaxID=1660198 RepID=A0A563E3Y9_9MICO|nr:NAD-binding protein [Leekyejoonella antrihumi]TWP37237.1 potassium transporter TrkA [Leekyejoonella antrihumi]
MTNPLIVAWHRMVGGQDASKDVESVPPRTASLVSDEAGQPEAAVLLVLRRLRVPIILVICIFSASVVGLSIIPGKNADGQVIHLSLFDSFYFISYTATTIGFTEINGELTTAQRMWVTLSIYLSVLGWAYGIGSLLALARDESFRRTLARRHVARKVRHFAEPFLILVGYGSTTKGIARTLDAMGRRFVVVDTHDARVSSVDLDGYRADTPALLGDARDTRNLVLAGLAHPQCEGVLALAGDDKVNLDVTMTTALLRPGLRIIAGTTSREMAGRMQSYADCDVVNHLDRFGDHLRILLRSPAAYRLMVWLTSAPGTPLLERRPRPAGGRWVVCGNGPFATELKSDLHAEGVEVTVVGTEDGHRLEEADLETAFAFVAASADDTTNVWLLESARRVNPRLFTVALEHRLSNVPLFQALDVDFGMTPPEIMSIEVMARLASPTLMRLLPQIPHLGDQWSVAMTDRLVERCGRRKPDLWRIHLDDEFARWVQPWLQGDGIPLGDLLRDPLDRDTSLAMVALALIRGGEALPGPSDDEVLRPGDELLIAAGTPARRMLEATLSDPVTAAYVMENRVVPSTWVWRKLSRRGSGLGAAR